MAKKKEIKEIKIENINIADLIPYENNPRINDHVVNYLVNSIREFGFRNPIIIDKNNVIVCGHTRLKACEKIGYTTVPCIRADDLTEDQVKAFRIADNKIAELAEWDLDKLSIELDEINLDMEAFGVEIEPIIEPISDDYDDGYYGDERERNFNSTNFSEYDETRAEGLYDMPTLEPVDYTPKKMIGFNYARSTDEYDACIHFYLDDYQFERIWNRPRENLRLLRKFEACLTPNYSIYLDMPKAIKIWNTYRSRLLGQMMQDDGITVIPIVYWGDKDTWDFCFDGLPVGGTLSINNIRDKNETARRIWDEGLAELIKRKQPKRILLYGNGVKESFDFGDIEVIYFTNSVTERMKEAQKKKEGA